MDQRSTGIIRDTADIKPFPEGSRILHIGPPKTGTTALQASCWTARASLLDQGVRYAGGKRHAARPARAVTGRPTITANERKIPSIRWWKALVREIERAREPRVLYSSEALAAADLDAIRRIASELGPALHILVTLRPIDSVLTSQWQQVVQQGSVETLDEWLRPVLGDESRVQGREGLSVLRHGELVERWAGVVGPEHLTVVVLDRSDPSFLFRTAETLLALRPGTLRAVDEMSNRSLSWPEIEVIRRMNLQAREAGVSDGARSSLVRYGAAANVQRKPAAEGAAKVRLPTWAAKRAAEMGEEAHRRIVASGVRIIGAPATLIPEPHKADGDVSGPDTGIWVDPETAATLAMGVAWGTGLRLGPNQPGGTRRLALAFVSTRALARVIWRRGRAWVRRERRLADLGNE